MTRTAIDPLASVADREDSPRRYTVELSVVMPCLNEAETLGTCIRKAQRAMTDHGIDGEIIVADNGSIDGSQELAADLGARVVSIPGKGYGNALMGGIAAAQGRYVIMGDADDSYDFLEIPRFLEGLRDGHDLVQGCRLPSGGGSIMPGAMPFLHRWWGNPMFSLLVRHWFNAPIHDVYCGLRGFSREMYERLGLQCTGMEFAVEMVIKSSLFQERIAEVPITLHPDGRKTRAPHLRTFRDGWRTLRFFLMYSPRWLFLVPGLVLILLGTLGYALALPGVTYRGVTLDVHSLLFASLFLLMGYQSVQFSILTKTFATAEGLLPPDPRLERFYRVASLERGLLLAAMAILGGVLLLGIAVRQWQLTGFGDLDYARTMRVVIPGVTLVALGFQTVLSGFFLSILGIPRR